MAEIGWKHLFNEYLYITDLLISIQNLPHISTNDCQNKVEQSYVVIHLPLFCPLYFMGLFFTQDDHISRFAQVMQCDQELFKQFFHGMLNEGVYFAPSAFEAAFVSSAHSDEDIAATISAAERVLNQL